MKALVKFAAGEGNIDVLDVDEPRRSGQDFTAGMGVDVALECAGHPSSVRACLDSLRPMGRYTQIAICGRDIAFPIDQMLYKQLTVRGSITYGAHVATDDGHLCPRLRPTA